MDEPIKPTTIRTLGNLPSRFGGLAGGSTPAPQQIDTGDKVKLKSSGDLTAEIAGLAAAVKEAAAQPIAADPNQPLYRVRSGDSLSMIAAATLGDASRWAEIAALNADQYPSLKHNPALIREGWTLMLPASAEAPAPQPEARAPRHRRGPANDDALIPVANADCPPKGKPGKAQPKPKPAANELADASQGVASAAGAYVKGAKPTTQQTKVVAVDTLTDTDWDVDGKRATVTDQQTQIVAADTRTATHWEQAAAPKPAPKKPIKPGVPVDLDLQALKPGKGDRLASQKTHVTGVDTDTASHWEVDGAEQHLTSQKTQITGADTHTDTVLKRDAQLGGQAAGGPVYEGPRVPVSLHGLKLEPGQNMEIESQETVIDEIDLGTDTHWQVDGDQAKVQQQKTNVTGAETITRTRWKVVGAQPQPQPVPPVQPPAPPKPRPCGEAEAVQWLQAHLDANGRISREAIATMPDGPGKDALLKHFDALLFGYIDPGKEGWVQLHRGDVDALARALADGGSIAGFAGQLTRRITQERGVGDLTGDGQVNEADLAAYAARLRGGQPYEPAKPVPTPVPTPATGEARMQHDLQVFLDERSNQNSDAALSLVRDHGKYAQIATPAQKASLIGLLLDGGGEAGRTAAVQLLQAASGRKELEATLEAVNQRRKGMDTLLNRLGDNAQGEQLASLLLANHLYQAPLVWQHMDDDATVSLCKALGFSHPMVGTSDDLAALSDEARNHMMKELTTGNVTWTELYMAQWINQHNQIPYRIPDYLTENQRR